MEKVTASIRVLADNEVAKAGELTVTRRGENNLAVQAPVVSKATALLIAESYPELITDMVMRAFAAQVREAAKAGEKEINNDIPSIVQAMLETGADGVRINKASLAQFFVDRIEDKLAAYLVAAGKDADGITATITAYKAQICALIWRGDAPVMSEVGKNNIRKLINVIAECAETNEGRFLLGQLNKVTTPDEL